MAKNSYPFAVAQIRSLENDLFTKIQYEQFLAAESEEDMIDLLAAHGYVIPQDCTDISVILDYNRLRVYNLIKDLSDGADELGVFTVKNDYHNLKTAIKAFFADKDGKENMLYPAGVDTETLNTAVKEKKYDSLSLRMAKAAAAAYETLTLSGDGQSADVIIDKYTLLELVDMANITKSETVKKYCLLTVFVSDIKSAYRGAKTRKGADFYENAICGTPLLEKAELSRAARKGEGEVVSYLLSKGFSAAAEALKKSVYDLEKWYDAEVMTIAKETIYENFNIDPLIAYGFKCENEIKNLRIALVCKNMGIKSAAMERMCVSDV